MRTLVGIMLALVVALPAHAAVELTITNWNFEYGTNGWVQERGEDAGIGVNEVPEAPGLDTNNHVCVLNTKDGPDGLWPPTGDGSETRKADIIANTLEVSVVPGATYVLNAAAGVRMDWSGSFPAFEAKMELWDGDSVLLSADNWVKPYNDANWYDPMGYWHGGLSWMSDLYTAQAGDSGNFTIKLCAATNLWCLLKYDRVRLFRLTRQFENGDFEQLSGGDMPAHWYRQVGQTLKGASIESGNPGNRVLIMNTYNGAGNSERPADVIAQTILTKLIAGETNSLAFDVGTEFGFDGQTYTGKAEVWTNDSLMYTLSDTAPAVTADNGYGGKYGPFNNVSGSFVSPVNFNGRVTLKLYAEPTLWCLLKYDNVVLDLAGPAQGTVVLIR